MDWKKKLTSRKLWMAVAGLATGIVMLINGQNDINGVIMALGSVVAYIVGEGLVASSK
jgi:hypothetical protein